MSTLGVNKWQNILYATGRVEKLEDFLGYLKGVLDTMSGTVQELRKSLG